MAALGHAIVILGDGDTWTTIDGCSICIISEEELDSLTVGEIDCEDLNPIYEIGLEGYPYSTPNPQPEG